MNMHKCTVIFVSRQRIDVVGGDETDYVLSIFKQEASYKSRYYFNNASIG
jgi:hypothetical protein